jgi:predicted transcriptional regulator YheO
MTKAAIRKSEDGLARERKLLIAQLKHVAEGLGATFAPFCEVVLHDLTHPKHAILAIHNNLSKRKIGEPATELGLSRIADPSYPQIVANYGNEFADGRKAKSTSIGIKDSSGIYVAALCLNIDVTVLSGLRSMLEQFASVDQHVAIKEVIQSGGADAIRARIDAFAVRLATTPRSLSLDDRRALIQELKEAGCLEIRKAPEVIAAHIGVSRATIYADAK